MEQVDGCHGPQVHVRRVLEQDLGVELEIAGGGACGPQPEAVEPRLQIAEDQVDGLLFARGHGNLAGLDADGAVLEPGGGEAGGRNHSVAAEPISPYVRPTTASRARKGTAAHRRSSRD